MPQDLASDPLVGQLPSLGVSSKSRYRLRGTCNRCGMPQDLATDPLVGQLPNIMALAIYHPESEALGVS